MSHASVSDHRAAIARLLGPGTCQTVVLDRHVAGRRVATDLVAADDLPRFDNSAMDGYAVLPVHPHQREFAVVADLPAGCPADVRLRPGEAARIMTGARVPDGALAIIPVEQTDATPTGPAPGRVTVTVDATPGRHIRRRGEDVVAGSVLAPTGTLITPRLIALARSAGCFAVVTWVPMRVAVVATGTELTDPDHLLGAGAIHESNSDMVGALAESAGCLVTSVDTCSDDLDGLTALLGDLDRREDVDLVVTTGGVSQGAFEVVRQVGASLGGFAFTHLAMQPGGPQGLGRVGTTPVVCFPGTPVGAYVSFQMLLRPVLDARHGHPPREPGSAAYRGKRRRVRMGSVQYITAVLAPDGTVGAADGRHLTGLAEANVLIEVPEGLDELVDGDDVVIHPL